MSKEKENSTQKPVDAEKLWKDIEDRMVPRLRVTMIERAAYYHLARHSRLEGKRRLKFSILWLAQGTRLATTTVRDAVRSLAAKRAIHIVERSQEGHVVEVLAPEEMPSCQKAAPGEEVLDVEAANFLENKELRETLFRREAGECFYCRRKLRNRTRVLDHVVSRARRGRNSYRNLVTCCVECNAAKGEKPAGDLLRRLFREGLLEANEVKERKRGLEELRKGQRKPVFEGRQAL